MTQILVLIDVAAALLATLHLLLRYRRPSAAVAWLFALWVLPFLGFLLYGMFAVAEAPRQIRRRRERTMHLRGPDRRVNLPQTPYPKGTAGAKLAALADRVNPFPLVGGNTLEILGGDDPAYERMFRLIGEAEREICLATYILAEGTIARRLRDLLIARAQAGVKVRLLFDHFGSFRLPAAWLAEAERGGVSWAGFLKPQPWKGRLQVNFRNHRKLLIVDGCRGVTGGQNWEDAHSTTAAAASGKRLIRDFNVAVSGPAVAAMRRVFLEDWCIARASAEDPAALEPKCEVPASCGDVALRVIPSGPDEERRSFLDITQEALHQAQTEICLVTPFFVPGETMRAALVHAALAGIKVRLLVPHRSDFWLADLAARQAFGTLLDAGVEIRMFEGPFNHAKVLIVDGRWACLGSSNFDQRSFYCNFELDLEVADPEQAAAIRDHFEPDFARATPLDAALFAKRSAWSRALSNAAALFEPLL